ncbi:ABC transporter substrate-binding protein [Streptoalloteichus hindustanus]|uniref:Amino acid ABC transporter substrate-binding protein, PAAT family n=1 Tax=Streptoalloteichus hindustanus TaxID=2017 RepID=A0A1M4UJL8_STRHI|nr:ABC transporter substrate-binding protein [Streptoalloteichus hindustanus]SHE56760.1 amino acid ABC transporter substrate-binding protein, PAAT family [Streptoalloteichus hindustanus]
MARRTRRQALALLPALALAVSVVGCAESVKPSSSSGGVPLVKQGELTTCTHLPYKPFQYDEGGRTVGFDVDLMDLVAKELGVQQKIVDTPFEGIQTGTDLNTGKCDLGAAAITMNDTRRKVLDFSDPYFEASQALLVRKGSGIRNLDDLRGKKVGVQLATTGEEYAHKHKDAKGYQVVQFEDLALMETAVLTGQVDAGVNDNGVLYDYVKGNADKVEVTTEFETGDQYGIAVKKGNDALRNKINEVVGKARSGGEYDRIYERWFGKKPPKK